MLPSAALKAVGIEFVVEGLQDFIGDVNKANGILDKLRPQQTILQKGFEAITDSLNAFGERLWNIATVTIGVMLRDAFEWLLRILKDIIASSFEAAAAFQLVEMRLKGLNLQAAIDSGLEYADAMKVAQEETKKQMDWVMKLAAITPYDAEDIAKTFTMATAFGFNTTAAKELTENILDFTAAMGLGSQEQERIIINLGQMVQRGKITTREMNDLARGSLVPLADVLDRVSEKMGITTEELTKLISKPGGGVDPQLFIDAFNEMVTGEERFQNAAVRMAHTFQGATENIKQSFRDVMGYFILLPGFLDPVGKRLGDIMDEVGERWDEITDAASRVGTALGNITNAILDVFFPSAETTVDGLISSLDRLASWLETNQDKIVDFFVGKEVTRFSLAEGFHTEREGGMLGGIKSFGDKAKEIYDWFVVNWPKIEGFFANIGKIIEEKITPWIEEHLIPAFDEIKKWVEDNKPAIDKFFQTLGEIGENVIGGLTGEKRSKGEETTLAGILDKILEVMQWIVDHKDDIATFLENWARFWLISLSIKTAAGFILDNLLGIIGAAESWGMALLIERFSKFNTDVSNIWTDLENIKNIDLQKTFQSWIDKLKASEWFQAGVAIMNNIIAGMGSLLSILVSKVVNMMLTAWNAALSALGIPAVPIPDSGDGGINGVSPTERTGNLGELLGKTKTSTTPSTGKATKSLLGAVTTPTTVASTSNYNLTINTKASKENILQDYVTLKSLRG